MTDQRIDVDFYHGKIYQHDPGIVCVKLFLHDIAYLLTFKALIITAADDILI